MSDWKQTLFISIICLTRYPFRNVALPISSVFVVVLSVFLAFFFLFCFLFYSPHPPTHPPTHTWSHSLSGNVGHLRRDTHVSPSNLSFDHVSPCSEYSFRSHRPACVRGCLTVPLGLRVPELDAFGWKFQKAHQPRHWQFYGQQKCMQLSCAYVKFLLS